MATNLLDEHPMTPRPTARWWMPAVLLALATSTGCRVKSDSLQEHAATSTRLMVPGELENLPSQPPDRRIAYGTDTSHFGELRVPSGPGPHPVAVLVHGGCFKAAYATRRDLEAMGDGSVSRVAVGQEPTSTSRTPSTTSECSQPNTRSTLAASCSLVTRPAGISRCGRQLVHACPQEAPFIQSIRFAYEGL